jgi:transcriptional regulator with XRE-family HTH domain
MKKRGGGSLRPTPLRSPSSRGHHLIFIQRLHAVLLWEETYLYRHKACDSVRMCLMKSPRSSLGAGERLKALRVQMQLTTREVERLSLQISESKRNPEYYISHAWVTDIENGKFTPSIYKLYSLSTIYHSRFTDVAAYFGLTLANIAIDQMAIRMPRTHLLSGGVSEAEGEVRLPVQLAAASGLDQTRTLSPLAEAWRELPISALQHMNSKDKLHGYIGLQDFTLYPIIRPGSFVEIDSRQNKVRAIPWTNEYDRPIYFVELNDGYVCSWCQLDDRELIIVPHPLSRQQIQRFKYPDEAEIVGRVTAVTIQLVDLEVEVPR